MARYFFNIHDGVTIMDAEGTEFEKREDARTQAIRLAGEVLREQPKRLMINEDWCMEVTDEKGFVLFRLDFRVMESPPMMGEFRSQNLSRG